MRTRDFGMGFFGRPFDIDSRKIMNEMWSKMTDEEKLKIINKRMEVFGGENQDAEEFTNKREFSVEAIDKRCEEWLKKTTEEKRKQP